jgi:ligand-binding sensor domain-containing protein
VLLIGGLTFFALALSAQSPAFENVSIEQGLPSNEVYHIYQDQRGFLWLSTDNGVVRFDGRDFEHFGMREGLTDPVVFNVFEDDNNTLWFRTFSGKLCFYRDGKIHPYRYNSRLMEFINVGLVDFHFDPADSLLTFLSGTHTGTIDSKGNMQVKKLKTTGVYCTKVGSRLLVSNYSLTKKLKTLIINGSELPVNPSDTVNDHRVFAAKEWHGKIYLSLNKDVFEYDGDSVRLVYTGRKPIISFSLDSENNFWVGYLNGGVTRFTNPDFGNADVSEIVKDKSVTSVKQDNEGGLWFATLENGVYHVPNPSLYCHFLNRRK